MDSIEIRPLRSGRIEKRLVFAISHIATFQIGLRKIIHIQRILLSKEEPIRRHLQDGDEDQSIEFDQKLEITPGSRRAWHPT